ncbi:MAG: radical SAM protein [Oscillatoriales cyanobacterium SM2_2_1]|nr:radical SAM protein [Oscillatoriales cyanobacterium SM2_2_1]
MNDPEVIAKDLSQFRDAVRNGLPYKPLYVKWKLIWACNLRCAMCRHWRDEAGSPLSTARILEVIDELASLGCQKIHLTGGEPTLRPDLEQLLQRMQSHGIRATMTTNGTLISPQRAESLVSAGLHKVNVSLDSPIPELHNFLRGHSWAWQHAIAGIRALRAVLTRPRSLRLNTVISAANYRSLAQLPDLAQRLGIDRLHLIPVDRHTEDLPPLSRWQILRYNAFVAPVLARKAIAAQLIDHPAAAFPFGRTWHDISQSIQGHYARTYYDHHPCFAPWIHALIDHHGQVSVCCMTTHQVVVGDLQQQSFVDLWHGEPYRQLRRQSNLPQLPQCRTCDMFLAQNRAIAQLLHTP